MKHLRTWLYALALLALASPGVSAQTDEGLLSITVAIQSREASVGKRAVVPIAKAGAPYRIARWLSA